MKTRFLSGLFLILMCSGISTRVRAQDIHFSQFYEISALRNPALTGIFDDDFKAGVIYRNQWNSLGSPYKTFAATGEIRFAINRSASDFLTIGATFFSDQAGRASLKTTGLYPSINLNKSLADPHNSYLSAGFIVGMLQRSFDPSKLTFDNQFQGGVVIPGAGAGEPLPMNKLEHWDLGAGVSFNSGVGEQNNLVYFLGLSAYHFTQPRATFAEQGELINLATRWNFSIGVHVTVNETWNVELHSNSAVQGRYNEAVVGGLLRWTQINSESQQDFALSGGAFWRVGDAVIPTMKVSYRKASLGISYDVNISKFKVATGMRGGLEVTAFITGLYGKNRYQDKRECPRF